MQNSFPHLGSPSRQSGGSSRRIHTTQISHPCDLSASIGNHLLRRNIWEALYHRLGVPVLGMFLQAEVAGKLLDMSHTWNENIRTYAGALVVTNYDKVYLKLLLENEIRKETHEGLLTD
jgi:hypothetical protein